MRALITFFGLVFSLNAYAVPYDLEGYLGVYQGTFTAVNRMGKELSGKCKLSVVWPSGTIAVNLNLEFEGIYGGPGAQWVPIKYREPYVRYPEWTPIPEWNAMIFKTTPTVSSFKIYFDRSSNRILKAEGSTSDWINDWTVYPSCQF